MLLISMWFLQFLVEFIPLCKSHTNELGPDRIQEQDQRTGNPCCKKKRELLALQSHINAHFSDLMPWKTVCISKPFEGRKRDGTYGRKTGDHAKTICGLGK